MKAQYLTQREAIHEGEIFRCVGCNYKTSNKAKLKSHILTEHKNIRFNCHICTYQAKQNRSLKVHILVEHDNFRFECHLCSQE